MPTLDDTAWIESQIAEVEADITAYRAAARAVAGGAQTYMLDTGQTRQSVTKASLGSLRKHIASLENDRETLRARLGYGGSHIGRPGF